MDLQNLDHSGGPTPGMSIRKLLQGLSVSQVGSLIGEELCRVLHELEPQLLESGEIVETALQLVSETEWIDDPSRRDRLIDLLPLVKVEELVSRLGVTSGPDPFKTLRSTLTDLDQDKRRTLAGFFGISLPAHASSRPALSASVQEVRPEYGLWDYQRLTAAAVGEALRETKTVLLHMPTGAGKTRTAMHLICDHLRAPEAETVFWLSEQPEVLRQSEEAFREAWMHLGNRPLPVHSLFGPGEISLEEIQGGFAVGGFQKLVALQGRDENALLRLGDRTTFVIVDEAHQAIAPTYATVIKALARKRRNTLLLGLTATPGRTWADLHEDRRLSQFFAGSKVTLVTSDDQNPIEFLIAEGYLARPTFQVLAFPHDSDYEECDTDSDLATVATADSIRNSAIVEEIINLSRKHQRILIFAASVQHAKLLDMLLRIKGLESHLVTADTRQEDRTYLYHRFRSTTEACMALVNYGVLTTGFDAPQASAAVIARPTRSLVLYSQMVGRALRGPRAGGTSTCEILTTVNTELPGFGSVKEAFANWEDVWNE